MFIPKIKLLSFVFIFASTSLTLSSCKQAQLETDSELQEAIRVKGKWARRCDLNTLDRDKTLDFMRKTGKNLSKSNLQTSQINTNIAYMSLFSFEYLYCATAKLIPMKNKSLPVELVINQLAKSNLIPASATKLLRHLANNKTQVKFKSLGRNKARLTIQLDTSNVAGIIGELKKQSIGKGIAALEFKRYKKGPFPSDKNFAFQKSIPKSLLSKARATGYEGRGFRKSALIEYSLGGFASAFSFLKGGGLLSFIRTRLSNLC